MSPASPESSRSSPSGAQLFRPHLTLFGVPVRIASSFWIVALLFGVPRDDAGRPGHALAAALTWTAVVLVSVLLHELGHALTARAFGASPTITLYAMGGLTSYQGGQMSRVQRTLISAAGPGTGLLVGAVVFAATRSPQMSSAARELIASVLWVNIGWSLINLLPVVPLDGGHILASVLGPKHAFATAVVSVVVGSAAAAAGFFYLNSLWIAFIFGGASMTAMRQARYGWQAATDRRRGLEDLLLKTRTAIAEGRVDDVFKLGDQIARQARTAVIRNGGFLAMAWAQATQGKPMQARETIERLERGTPVDPYFLAVVEDALGSPVRARAILEAARMQGAKSVDTTKLLIDLWAREGDIARATELALEDADTLGRADARAVFLAAMQHGAHRSAAELAARLFTLYGDPSDALDEARAFALAGDRSRALDLLELWAQAESVESRQSRAIQTETLRNDPAFEGLRSDERFQRLVSA